MQQELKQPQKRDKSQKGTVYLICLDEKIHHAKHYIGWSKFFKQRIEHHRRKTGAKFLAKAVRRRIPFEVVRTWHNKDGHFERKLKRQKNAKFFCPNCTAKPRK